MKLLTLQDLAGALPLIVLFLCSLIPITLKVLNQNKERSFIIALGPALLGLVSMAGLAAVLFSGQQFEIFSGTLVADGLTAAMMVLIAALGIGTLFVMKDSPSIPLEQASEFVFLFLGMIAGMFVLVAANDLVTVFIGLETMSLALYVLVALSREQKLSKESAFKYFILGSFASGIYLYGVAFIFGTTGSTNLTDIAAAAPALINTNILFLFGVAMVLLSFCFKVSIFPFHAWTPDVYQGAATPLSGFMATAVKAASFTAFLRIALTQVFAEADSLVAAMQWLAVLTMLIGNVAAILQDNFKRMLAYSSVSHSGYLMTALIVAGVSDNFVDVASTGFVFYIIAYSLMTLGAFAVVSLMEKSENTLVLIEDFSGLGFKRPALAIAMTIFLLSLAGVPPMIGFFGKLYLFSAAISEGFIWLAVWGVINSVISVYYYLRPIVFMYMSGTEAPAFSRNSFLTQVTVTLTAIIVITFGLFSSPLLNAVQASILSLF